MSVITKVTKDGIATTASTKILRFDVLAAIYVIVLFSNIIVSLSSSQDLNDSDNTRTIKKQIS